MKTLLLAMAIMFTSASFAGNEGPQAMPPKPQFMIAQVVLNIAFGPIDAPRSLSVEIFSNGNVQSTTNYRDNNSVVKKLATLSPEVLAKVSALVESTEAGELYDPSPEQPGCFDAPTTTYYAIKSNGEKIAVAQQMQCKDLQKRTATSGDYDLKHTLSGLTSLADLFKF